MKTLLIFIIVIFICSLYLTKTKISQEGNILILTTFNFNEAVKEFNNLLVAFYEPGCENCDYFETEYKILADKINEDKSGIHLAKVDSSLNPKLVQKYKIEISPTVKFFVNQTIIDYDGSYKSDEILRWINKKSVPNPFPINSLQELDRLKNLYDIVGLGLFKSLDSIDVITYKNVSALYSFESIMFSISSDDDLYKYYSIKSDKAFILFRKFNNDHIVFDDSFNKDKLTKFIKINRIPDVVEYTRKNAEIVFDSTYDIHNVLMISQKDKKFNQSLNEFKEAAKHFKEKVMFVLINYDINGNEKSLKSFRVSKNETPTFRLIKSPQMTKYKPISDMIKADNIIKFVQDCLDKKARPELLSEELPDDWNVQPLKTLVGSNFEQVAKDQSKSVLVLFYASWEEKSKELIVILEKLAFNFKDKSEYVVAKTECTLNEFEEFRIENIPTLKLFPKESNEYIIYNNTHTLDNLSLFLESHGKNGNNISKKVKDEL